MPNKKTAIYTQTGISIGNDKSVKRINRDDFFKCLELFVQGRATTKVCAEALGLSEPTLKKRFNVVLLGINPPDFWWLKEDEEVDPRTFGKGLKYKGYTFDKDCKRWQEQTKFRKLKQDLKNMSRGKEEARKR